MGRRLAFYQALIGAALALGVIGTAAAEDQAPPLSPAQIALFESDHLKSITKPVRLDYAFDHHGGSGDFTDKVSETIREVHEDGGKDVAVEFLTGEHQTNFPPVNGFHGNPVLMYFLEHDVFELRQATGGAATYFRNRIRRAFLDGADVHPTEVSVDGKKQAATEIVITPFRNDAQIGRFPGVADKSYSFVLCDAVPGTIYRISTSVPKPAAPTDAATPAAPVPAAFEESMTYSGEHDATP
ncbi:MAG TPA: hypothetical protein VJO12_17870 [Stellaceae bacterium]|nr:hypothetical protein [Stellaceae bacterium]